MNNSINTSTKLTPASIVYGYEPRMPYNINTTYNLDFADCMKYYTQIAQDNMLDAQIEQAVHYNKRRKEIVLEEGTLVLVARSVLNPIKNYIKENEFKLLPRYSGPFKVIKRNGNTDNYIIRVHNSKNGTRVVNINNIRIFDEIDRKLLLRRKKNNYKPLIEEIEKIYDSRIRKFGKGERLEYRIRHKHSNEDNDLWVPDYYLDECQELIDEFERSNQLNQN